MPYRAGIAGWRFILPILAALSLWFLPARAGSAVEEIANPYLGQPDAAAAGRDIYGSKCYICHHKAGARGPNLFATKLTDEQFLEIVINGKQGTQMPGFGLRLSPGEVWQVHAFVKSTDRF